MTTRRRFLVTLGASALAMPRRSLAQAQSKAARVGFLYFASRESALESGRYQAFVQGMHELGYVEGTNLAIEARFADGSTERIPALATELVRSNVAVIVATGTVVTRVLQYAAPGIPVVTTVANDRSVMALPQAWRAPAASGVARRPPAIAAMNRRRPTDMSDQAVRFGRNRPCSLLPRIVGSLAETEKAQIRKVNSCGPSRPGVRACPD